MSPVAPIDPADFVSTLRPYLQGQDLGGLAQTVRQRWTYPQIANLFVSPDPDARKVAALAYGLVGGKGCLEQLVPLLRDPDPVVAQMTEHALWSVWFRLGSPDANKQLCRGTRCMARGDLEQAIHHFTQAVTTDPEFAEAYNQRAIAHFLLDQFDDSIDDCRKTISLMPFHFGAMAGLGHCHAHEGRIGPAIRSYEKALKIHPRLDDVRAAVAELREQLCSDQQDGNSESV